MVLSAASKLQPRTLLALDFVIKHCLMLASVTCVRIGHGVKRFPNMSGTAHSTLFWWFDHDAANLMVFDSEFVGLVSASIVGERYPRAFMLQAVLANDASANCITDSTQDIAKHSLDNDYDPTEQLSDRQTTTEADSIHDRLSTIAEEGSDTSSFHTFLAAHFSDCQPADEVHLLDAWVALLLEEAANQAPDLPAECPQPAQVYLAPGVECLPEPIEEHIHYLTAGVPASLYGQPNATDDNNNPCVEFYFTRDMAKCVLDDSNMSVDEVVVMQVLLAGVKQAVIKRLTDVLTPTELKQNFKEVQAAILEELRIWVKYNCFERTPRAGARNILDSRYVAKWKFVDGKRIIRMRMAMRGFKDWDADSINSYAGTASRASQKVLSSEVACHPDWVMISIDINKAFLQGMTYKEIHELTGEAERTVHFTLPPGSAAVLRLIPGYEDFDERSEVLRCIKPGTGTKDAPRAFSLKLASVTQSPACRMVPTTMDREFEVRHDDGRLVAMQVKHVDDVKMGGETAIVHDIIAKLEVVFGKLAYHKQEFTNCGVHHVQHADGSVEMDQDEYVKALIPIQHESLIGASPEAELGPELTAKFWSLLGALAYALMTQHWLAVYVISLQRVTHKPLIIHVRRLNALIRVVQKTPAHILFRAMNCQRQVEAHSDSGFSKEQEKGYGIRGANIMRKGVERCSGDVVYHLVESQCQSHKHVTRSTFSAETLAAVAAADSLIPVGLTFHEIVHGPCSPSQARRLREEGGYAFNSVLTVDAMSLFAAVAAHTVKVPSEKNLAGHLFWLRELLDRQVINTLQWCDTRDMTADCHTKGSIDRAAILSLMKGIFKFEHETKKYPT
ncbi:unnamed protein product [Polarella glacialis]|uniref:Reverse transcriptase Ty1/copia-type domain-containing protein n=1 Tax=Polarella glacialis TaxID=89957 RepID=A0A813E659_POLGL|nr:unnamed protein product [Polarella glacialis]